MLKRFLRLGPVLCDDFWGGRTQALEIRSLPGPQRNTLGASLKDNLAV